MNASMACRSSTVLLALRPRKAFQDKMLELTATLPTFCVKAK